MEAVLKKELRAEEWVQSQAGKAKKEAGLMKMRLEGEVDSLKHDLEMANTQKDRQISELKGLAEQKMKAKDNALASLQKETELKSSNARKHADEEIALLDGKLKRAEQDLAAAHAEVVQLKAELEEDEVEEEDIEITIEREIVIERRSN